MATGLEEYAKKIEELCKKQAVVGWFPDSAYPNGETVASVALKQEFGDGKRIPPRPFIRPTIASEKGTWGKIVGKLVDDTGFSANDVFESIGLKMVGDIRKTAGLVTSPPLAAYTIAKRNERGNSNEQPLNDTGYMLASLTNTVKNKDELA